MDVHRTIFYHTENIQFTGKSLLYLFQLRVDINDAGDKIKFASIKLPEIQPNEFKNDSSERRIETGACN